MMSVDRVWTGFRYRGAHELSAARPEPAAATGAEARQDVAWHPGVVVRRRACAGLAVGVVLLRQVAQKRKEAFSP